MSTPDLSTLTEQELQTVAAEAQQRLQAIANAERQVEQTLRDPVAVAAAITALQEQQGRAQEVIDTPNADVNGQPAPHIMKLARAQKRTIAQLIRALRLEARLFESDDLGDEGVA